MKEIQTNHGSIKLPAFMPDATYGSIRSTSFPDIQKAGINEIVTTTLHIEQKIGSEYVKKLGGIHTFFNWDRPILTDSGGWQVFSLINKQGASSKNKVTKVGCTFVDPDSGKTSLLTPESSIQIQLNLGADILTVLDNPIDPTISLVERKKALEINTNWAKRAKQSFAQGAVPTGRQEGEGEKSFAQEKNKNKEQEQEGRQNTPSQSPILGAVIQGGDDFDLRKQSAEELIEIGFDIYNFGGIPLYSEISWKYDYPQGLYREMLQYVRELIPQDAISYAMGIGQPDDIAYCVDIGWDLFDTVLPTRNARHGYLYVSEGQGDQTKEYKSEIQNSTLPKKRYAYDVMHLRSERYKDDMNPVDDVCDCECCSTVSRAYLRHLIRIKEPAGFRLATIHNLRFYSKWMESLLTSSIE